MRFSWNDKSAAIAVTVIFIFSSHAAAQESYAPWPEPDSGYVTDKAEVLSESEEERLEQWLIRVEENAGVEIIVVTLHSFHGYPGADDSSIEAFATGLFDRWGIGNLPRNDGILLLVAIMDRKVRIELGRGYGDVRNDDAERIIREEILPSFRKRRYGEGITRGTRAIIN
ncbi:MAG: TPM domain-containing protein, partial [Thermoanaerobaculia bacterium]|nr:TPM domain-containing protein [Thermoanaerobaculia bacterium]